MVADRITGGRRIAELLASELDGRSDGPLESVAVVNADPDAEPVDGGARAYDVAVGGSVVATVFVHPERVRIETTAEETTIDGNRIDVTAADGVSIRRGSGVGAEAETRTVILVEYGAAVKRAVDVLSAAIRGRD
jgi:hypothetical protein